MATLTSDDNLLAVSERILTYCERDNLKIFDGFFPIVPDLFDDDDENYGFWTDTMPDSLENAPNSSIFIFGNPDGVKAEKEAHHFRFRSITRKELRKRTGVFAMNPYCLEMGVENYKKITDAFFTVNNGDLKLIEIPGSQYPPNMIDGIYHWAHICMAAQFNLENQNYVYLKPENAKIGFKLPLDDLGQVKELFAMRDVPDGYKRRAALRHWVAKHMRKKPSKPDEKVEVKRHLRGKEEFSWYGMKGTIYTNV